MRTATHAAASLCLLMAVPSASAAARDCNAVAAFTWPDTAIDRVEQLAAGTVLPFGTGNLPSGAAQDPDVVAFLPAHCLVRGTISGTADRASALARGPAVVTTDAGHLSDNLASPATDGRFAADLRARTDNARDAVPLVT